MEGNRADTDSGPPPVFFVRKKGTGKEIEREEEKERERERERTNHNETLPGVKRIYNLRCFLL
jgi:hypothetical protein